MTNDTAMTKQESEVMIEQLKKVFEEALVENKKLSNNDYMPKDRYNAIINRLENKLKKLK